MAGTRRAAPSKAVQEKAAARARNQRALDLSPAVQGLICGVDEAGRGPLAGPVVAAAVILNPDHPIAGLDDSKALSARKREALFVEIRAHALAYCVAWASVEEIDTLNILQATMLAMQRAVQGLAVTPALAQIDGNRCPKLAVPAQAIIGGDALVPAISAASILAKVTRDAMLTELHAQHPEYGFDVHSGYGTARHMAALHAHGPCVHHRRSFAPVREAWARVDATALTLPVNAAAVPLPPAAELPQVSAGAMASEPLPDVQPVLF